MKRTMNELKSQEKYSSDEINIPNLQHLHEKEFKKFIQTIIEDVFLMSMKESLIKENKNNTNIALLNFIFEDLENVNTFHSNFKNNSNLMKGPGFIYQSFEESEPVR